MGAHVPGRFEVVRVWRKSFCRHYFYLLQHQNCLATTDHATFGFYFSLAVLGSIGDTFGSINLRSYCSKSKFYDVFNKVKCPRLENTDKALSAQYFSPDHPKITKGLMVDLSWKTAKFKQQMEFQSFTKLYRILRKFTCGVSSFFFLPSINEGLTATMRVINNAVFTFYQIVQRLWKVQW